MNHVSTEHWFVFVLCVLSTFRLASMFSKELGPGRIFAKIRRAPPPKSTAREGLSCPYCVGAWWAACAAGYVCWLGYCDLRHLPLWWLGIAAGAFICNVLFSDDPSGS